MLCRWLIVFSERLVYRQQSLWLFSRSMTQIVSLFVYLFVYLSVLVV